MSDDAQSAWFWDSSLSPHNRYSFLFKWGTPLLYGPGSINVAHTDDEHVKVADLHKAVSDYARLTKYLLAQ